MVGNPRRFKVIFLENYRNKHYIRELINVARHARRLFTVNRFQCCKLCLQKLNVLVFYIVII